MAKAIVEAGHEAVVFFPCKEKKDAVEECIDENVLLVQVPVRALGVHSLFNGRYLLKYKIDIAQIAGDNQLFAPELLRFCRRNNILAYTYNGTVQSDTENKLKKAIFDLLFKRNVFAYNKHECFAKTTAVAKQLKKRGVSKVTVAPVGLDVSTIPSITENLKKIRKKLSLPVDKKILLFVGRLETYKSPECAVELLKQLPKDCYLVMIGNGSKAEDIDALIAKYKLGERVRQIAQISNKEIHEYYAACDYYVNFNRNEIFGMAILEAMYNGCTVIAHSAPGPDFIIQDGKVGYIANDIESMKNVIESKEIICRDIICQYIIQNFTWENTAGIILNKMTGGRHG